MAINEDDLDLDTEKEEGEEGEKKPSGTKKIILIVVLALVVIGVTVGATLYFTGVFDGDDSSKAVATAEGGDTAAGEDAPAKKEAKAKDLSDEAIYHLFEPPFTVNFNDNGKIRFLQIGLSVSTRDKDAIEIMLQHEPVIRNNLVLLFSGQKSEDLYTRDGKSKLRDDTLAEIQNIMSANTGDKAIDNVYFTGFVIQ